MLTSTLLVTVHGPFKTLDLELPSDVAVGELIPLLLEICGSGEDDPQKMRGAPISLQVAGGRAPLSLEKTLLGAGVSDGAVLVLSTSPLAESPAPRRFVPRLVQPPAGSDGIGVTWESLE